MHRCVGTVVVCLLPAIFAAKVFSQMSSIDVMAYDLQVNVDLANHRLNVSAQMDVQKPDTLAAMELLFSPEAKIRSIQAVSDGG